MKLAVFAVLGALLMGSLMSAQDPTPKPELKEFLYRVRATRPEMLRSGPTPEESAAVEDHVNYLKDLTAKGTLIVAGRTRNNDETTFGIIVFRAASEDATRAIMNRDPAVKKGVFRSALFPFAVAFIEAGRQP
jgi:uncharacterized protein YciI